MSNTIDFTRAETLAKCSLPVLREARKDALGHNDVEFAQACQNAMHVRSQMQTPEIEDGGELFEHVEPPSRENGNRYITRFTGDPAAWMAPLMLAGATARLNRAACAGDQAVGIELLHK